MHILSANKRFYAVFSYIILSVFFALGQERQEKQAELLFRFPVAGIVTSGPVTNGNMIWLISDAKTLYVLTSSGQVIGKRTLPYKKASFMACDNFGRAALDDGNGGIVLINKAGQEVWRIDSFKDQPPLSQAPLFASDGRIYIVRQKIVSCLAPNGKLLWQYVLQSNPSTKMIIAFNGGPALGLSDGHLAVFWPDGGEPLLYKLGSVPSVLTATRGHIIAACNNSELFFIEADSQVRPINFIVKNIINIASSDDAIYLLTSSGKFTAITHQGLELWSTNLALRDTTTSIHVYNNKIIILSKLDVWSYELNAKFNKQLKLTNAVSMPVLDSAASIFSGGKDWILYAYRFELGLEQLAQPKIMAITSNDIKLAAKAEAMWALPSANDTDYMHRVLEIKEITESNIIDSNKRDNMLYLALVALNNLDRPTLPMTRELACIILGNMALPSSLPVLLDVFKNDSDDAVRAAAIRAVGQIGLDPDGLALDAFATALSKQLSGGIALALVEAIDALYKAGGMLNKTAGILALVRLTGANYPYTVRSKAHSAIDSIKSSK